MPGCKIQPIKLSIPDCDNELSFYMASLLIGVGILAMSQYPNANMDNSMLNSSTVITFNLMMQCLKINLTSIGKTPSNSTCITSWTSCSEE